MTDLHAWTSLFPASTGLPVTVWVSVGGVVATDPHDPGKIAHPEAIAAWMELNHDVLLAHRRGEIDSGELSRVLKRVP